MSVTHVAVVGAGPAGVVCAIGLKRRGFSVTLIGDNATRVPVETIGPEAVLEFSKLNHQPSATAFRRCSGIAAQWGDSSTQIYPFIRNPYGHGWHTSHARFLDEFRHVVEQFSITCRTDTVQSIQHDDGNWSLDFASGRRLSCDFVVDASGRRSIVARQLIVHRVRHDNLVAVGAIVDGTCETESLNVESAPDGWWYCCPAPGAGTLICFVSDADIIGQLGATHPDVWTAMLERTVLIRKALDRALGTCKLQAYPCETAALESMSGNQWLAIGDAATAFDPLAGHGVLRAVQSATAAAGAIRAWFDGDANGIRRYEAVRRSEFTAFLAATRQQYRRESRWRSREFWRRRAA
jgi:2-polyprenyl-6-methoxyphenol hydroxylase-like FAD-dependent oxidoreductase